MPKITKEIHSALEDLIRDSDSALAVAKKIGVGHSTVGKWRSGKIQKINNITWQNLYPLLTPYLSDNLQKIPVQEQVNSALSVHSICRYALEILQDETIQPDKKIRLLTLYFKEKI